MARSHCGSNAPTWLKTIRRTTADEKQTKFCTNISVEDAAARRQWRLRRDGKRLPVSSINDRRQNTTPTFGPIREQRELLLEFGRQPGIVGIEEGDELASARPMPRFFARGWPSRSARK